MSTRAIRVVSLFSGGGFAERALQLASERAGIPAEVVMAVDSWEPAARVRDANLAGVRTTIASVKDMTRADLPPHDLVIGGPPCQPFSMAGKRAGASDPRDCVPDFARLADGSAWLMENVVKGLVPGWSERLRASDFGDVTSRRRWFYSSHVLHVHPTPGLRRFRDIRDHNADATARDRSADVARKIAIETARQGRGYGFPPRDDGGFLGSLGATSADRLQSGSTLVAMRSYPQPYSPIAEDVVLVSVTSHTHDQPLRAGAVPDDGVLGSLTSSSAHGHKNNGSGERTAGSLVRVGMRGHGSDTTEIIDGAFLSSASASASSSHGTPANAGVRCPSLLEMARAHSISDSWDWAGTTKTQRGQIIANGWPIGMGAAVCEATLKAIAAERRISSPHRTHEDAA